MIFRLFRRSSIPKLHKIYFLRLNFAESGSGIDKFKMFAETGNDRNCSGCHYCCLDYKCWLRAQETLTIEFYSNLILRIRV